MSKARTIAALAFLLGAAVVGYKIMDLHSLGALGESNDAPSQAEIERLAGFPIPAPADLQARVDLVITKRTLYLRFSLSRDELKSFLRDRHIDPASQADVPRDLLSSDRPAWFTPERAREFLSWEEGRRAMLIDVTDASRATMYLKARG